MPYNGSGSYAPPAADFPAVSLTLIQASKFNNIMNDVSTALSTAITKDGQTTITANIPFAGFAIDNARLWAVDGAVGTPAITFKNDTDSGLYRIGANNVGMALNGAKMVDYATTGTTFSVGAGVGATNQNSGMNIGGTGLAIGTDTRGYRTAMTHPNTATTTVYGFSAIETLAAGGGTYATYAAFKANNVSKDAGDAITEQNGFDCAALTTGVSNYGFRGRINSAAGRFNLFMSGTADNALAGNLRVGSTSAPTVALDVTGSAQMSGTGAFGGSLVAANVLTLTGANTTGTTQRGMNILPTFTSATTAANGITIAGTLSDTGGAGTYTLYQGVRVNDVTKAGGADTLTTQIGYDTADLSIAGTLIAGFRSQVSAAAGKWGFYASGSANNAFSGSVRIGSVVAPTVALDVTGEILASTAIRSSGATSGIGYATGAGGTANQGAGSGKSTGVTLNKATGQITMNNALLGAGTRVTFTVTNSAVATTDGIVAWHDSGGTLGVYEVMTSNVGAGVFDISVKNDTGGGLSESPVIGFAVIKGVIA